MENLGSKKPINDFLDYFGKGVPQCCAAATATQNDASSSAFDSYDIDCHTL